ncbi:MULTISPECIES: response regulator transcription factor [Parabacteroides]|uniref:response regulator transcription factor n=1 Tax=Parabacteroides leei TaxID=2939491 RepID=UPI00189A3381|nr:MULTISPECIES: response regulator transcription factor [Parabacteroides]MCL3854588.1 response regulator transcription factor [Parabacteroides leei]
MIHILLAEDEIALAKIIKDSLESRHEFRITLASHGNEALKLYQKQKPDILVLDVMMPQMDGFTLTKMIRQIDTRTPILFLTARSSVDDLVTGFHLGGNDYLKKPFDMEELIVRIQALLNRPISISDPKSQEVFTIGQYTFHYPHQTLQISDQTETLSHREAEILRLLCLHANDVLHRKPVLMGLWGDDSFFNARSMDVFITKLRKKLKADPSVQIVNLRGIGYKLII